MEKLISRPIISEFKEPVDFVDAMLKYRKTSEPSFSVMTATRTLRKVSPALVSLILKRKRRLSLDRLDEISKLLNLNASEKFYFKNWVQSLESNLLDDSVVDLPKVKLRKESGLHLLNDWLNVYVKDYFMLPEVQNNPQLIYEKLSTIAPPQRINKSIQYLLKHGYLRKTLNGSVVVDTPLNTTESPTPHKKIRQFHKKALSIASHNLELFSMSERMANTFTLALTEKQHDELRDYIVEFTEKLKDFAEKTPNKSEKIKLYQLIINLSPAGGK